MSRKKNYFGKDGEFRKEPSKLFSNAPRRRTRTSSADRGCNFDSGHKRSRLAEMATGQIDIDVLPIALRAYTNKMSEPKPKSARMIRRKPANQFDHVLIFDTETTIDPSQRFLFGSYRLMDLKTKAFFEEGIIYEDGLPAKDPTGFSRLKRYVQVTRPDRVKGRNQEIRILSAHEFFVPKAHKCPIDRARLTTCHVDRDFNEGVKFLTMAIDKFRNEKSHTADARIEDPVRAYEYLRLASLAMHLLDGADLQESVPRQNVKRKRPKS